MPKNGNSRQKAAARRVQEAHGIAYNLAMRVLTQNKRDDETWTNTADRLVAVEGEE